MKKSKLKSKANKKNSRINELPSLKVEAAKFSKRIEKKIESQKNESKTERKLPPLVSLDDVSLVKKKPPFITSMKKRSNSVATINVSGLYQLDKRQRFEIFKRRLKAKPPVKNTEEAIQLINNTLVEIEDQYAPKKDSKFCALNSKKYGRMYPIPEDRIKFNLDTGITEMLAVGIIIYVYGNGSIEIWTVSRGNFFPNKILAKSGA
ncbi:hypothetical protein BpHYR1_036926 [Brachionus plicatilis]|uniref:Uncharacterized protein n=1 Tax=Brachionus plicatilis TaxID=10195 RepID=A0A3M7PJB6_BRAPC|nr:hypothetical protein BpHYR1_036926 [Brachionus plicatilis]